MIRPDHPHLLFVVNADWFFLSHRLPLAQAARDAGFRVTVVAGDTGVSADIINRGFEFVRLPVARGTMSPVEAARAVLRLVQIYRYARPDIIHHVALKGVIYGGLAAQIACVPRVVNALSGLGYAFVEREKRHGLRLIVETLLRFVLRHPQSRLILQNADDAALFSRRRLISEERVVLIRGSGVNCDSFEYAPESDGGPAIVLLPGRMLWDKGVAEFVEAARLVRRWSSLSVRFLLVGGADSQNPAAVPISELQTWHHEGQVEWLGHQEDMAAVLSRAHVVALPSYREGLPKALLEAAAVGRAIVATDVPGCREVVTHKVNGLLVPARDPEALAHAILHLIQHPEERRLYGRNGRRIVEREFSTDRVVSQTMQLYHSMLEDAYSATPRAMMLDHGTV